MTLTTGTAGPLLTPEQVESLFIKPVLAASVALTPLRSRCCGRPPLRPAARRHRRTPPDPRAGREPVHQARPGRLGGAEPVVLAGAAADRPSVRLPAVTADPTAAWVAEGAELPVSNLTTAEVDVVTRKVAGFSV